MKKFLPYLIIIIVLIGVAAWLLINKTNGTDDLKVNAFAVQNTQSITRVVLASTDKTKIELTKVNGIWMLNGKYVAREELVQSLFEVFSRVTILCPVPKAGHDNVLRDMLGTNVKVDVYAGSDKPEKSYYVGGPTTDGQGTYMLLEVDGKPVSRPSITYIPGVLGYLTGRFSTDEENWRSKVLFNYTADDIKSLSLEYPGDEKNSFIIQKVAKDSFELMPKEDKYKHKEPYQQKYILQYLSFYNSISIEAFDNTYSKKDSIMHTTPYCIFSITGADNTVSKVNLYHMPVSERSKAQYDEKGNEMPFDIDHFHASIHNDKDFAIVQYYVFGKLLRNYSDFFFKPGSEPKP